MTASSFRLPPPPGPRAALVLARVARGLREALLAVVRPSLVRRLLVAQLALLMLLWVLGIAYLLHQGGRAFLLLQSKQIYPTILAIADDTDSTPERRRQALDLLHASIVEEYDTSPERQPAILVTRGTQVLYRSRNARALGRGGPWRPHRVGRGGRSPRPAGRGATAAAVARCAARRHGVFSPMAMDTRSPLH